MKNCNNLINLIISKFKVGQEPLHEKIDLALQENAEMPEGLLVYFALSTMLHNPDLTNWATLMENIESLLKTDDREQIRLIEQYVLETLSNSIGNGEFDHKLITDHVGKLSREYIEAYDKFMGGKTPGF